MAVDAFCNTAPLTPDGDRVRHTIRAEGVGHLARVAAVVMTARWREAEAAVTQEASAGVEEMC